MRRKLGGLQHQEWVSPRCVCPGCPPTLISYIQHSVNHSIGLFVGDGDDTACRHSMEAIIVNLCTIKLHETSLGMTEFQIYDRFQRSDRRSNGAATRRNVWLQVFGGGRAML